MASYITFVFLSLTFAGGGSGFVGRHLQKCLRKKGYNVKIISRHPQKDALTWVSLPKCFSCQLLYPMMKFYGQLTGVSQICTDGDLPH